MIGPYNNTEDVIKELLHWQKLALQYKKESKYYKQQMLDKDREMYEMLGILFYD